MNVQNRATITDAEVLSVTNGFDDATGQPIVCLTLRQGSGWSPVNLSLSVENARSLFGRLDSILADELPCSPGSRSSR